MQCSVEYSFADRTRCKANDIGAVVQVCQGVRCEDRDAAEMVVVSCTNSNKYGSHKTSGRGRGGTLCTVYRRTPGMNWFEDCTRKELVILLGMSMVPQSVLVSLAMRSVRPWVHPTGGRSGQPWDLQSVRRLDAPKAWPWELLLAMRLGLQMVMLLVVRSEWPSESTLGSQKERGLELALELLLGKTWGKQLGLLSASHLVRS